MTGIVLSGMGLGSMMTPPLATQLIITYGWRPSWTIVGVTAMIIIILAAQFVRREPAQVGQLPDGKNEVEAESLDLQAEGLSLGEAVRTMHFWILCAVFGCLWFSSMAIWVHLVVHAIDLGIPAINASGILAVMGGVGIISRVLMGNVADRVGYKPTLLIGFALVSASLLWLLTAKELWALNLFAVIFGFGISGLIVLESPLIARLFGLASLSVIFASIEFVSMIFGAVSPIMAGLIFDTTGSYQLAWLVCGALASAGLIATWLLTITRLQRGTTDLREDK